jgi:hypothetical protein
MIGGMGWRLITGGLRRGGPSLELLDVDATPLAVPFTPDGLMREALLTLKALAPTMPDTAANLGGGDSIAADASMANGMEASVMERANANETINLAPERQNDVWA